MQTSFTVEGDASPATLKEIKNMLFDHGDGCRGYLEEKHSVLIQDSLTLDGSPLLEVYQLPIIEEL